MTLENYKQRLECHDWYYIMSDDPRWYDSGLVEERTLYELAEENPEFMKAFQTAKDKFFSPNEKT